MQDELKRLLESGVSKAEAAHRLGVSASTVTRHATRLGFARRPRRRRIDWEAVQRFHDAGRSPAECRGRFGFSSGAWEAAAMRGDLVPRPRAAAARAAVRRDQVRALAAEGVSAAEIARRLGVTGSTVGYHLLALGAAADARFARRYDWTVIRAAYDGGLSPGQCRRRFGFSPAAWRSAVARGDVVPRPNGMPITELLAGPRSRTHLKGRLVAAGLKEPRCEVCGIDSWQGRPLSLALHHVNGVGDDNRLENLQLLCPNCHSQTENFAGRNARARASREEAA